MIFKPLDDAVILEPIAAPERSQGGIYFPEQSQQRKAIFATVVAVGPGHLCENGQRVASLLKKGDVVLIPQLGGDEFTLHGKTYRSLAERLIMTRVVDEGATTSLFAER